MKDNKKKKSNKIPLYLVLLFVSTLFIGVGYSAINGVVLDMGGHAAAESPEELFIADAYVSGSTNGAIQTNSEVILTSQTMMQSRTELSSTNSNSTVTYTVIIKNNTEDHYVFDQVVYDEGFYDNNNITYQLSGISQGYELEEGEMVTFTITFKYSGTNTTNNILNSYINFRFNLLRTYNITYSGITNTGYPDDIVENGQLVVPFNNSNYLVTSVIMNEQTLTTSQYSYTRGGSLTINQVTGNVVITVQDISGVTIKLESSTNSFSIPVSGNISTLQGVTYSGVNVSGKTFKSVTFTLNYSTNGNPSDSLSIGINVNGTSVGSGAFAFKNKGTSTTVTLSNLNIADNTMFDIVFTNVKSSKVTLSSLSASVTYQ